VGKSTKIISKYCGIIHQFSQSSVDIVEIYRNLESSGLSHGIFRFSYPRLRIPPRVTQAMLLQQVLEANSSQGVSDGVLRDLVSHAGIQQLILVKQVMSQADSLRIFFNVLKYLDY
jgi:hypothetical protein